MKWIPIAKAKVKFKQAYLLADKDGITPEIATLLKTETTATGLVHTFSTNKGEEVKSVTHVAAITLPSES